MYLDDSSRGEETQRCKSEDGIYMIPSENHKDDLYQNDPKFREQIKRKKSEYEDEKVDSEEEIIFSKESNRKEEIYAKLRDIFHIVLVSIGIVSGCAVLSIPWTTIPRSNSIIHQSRWIEASLP